MFFEACLIKMLLVLYDACLTKMMPMLMLLVVYLKCILLSILFLFRVLKMLLTLSFLALMQLFLEKQTAKDDTRTIHNPYYESQLQNIYNTWFSQRFSKTVAKLQNCCCC